MEAAIVAHDTSKQEDAIRMNQQHVNQCVKEYSYSHTEFKCIIIDACEHATTDAHANDLVSKQSTWQSRSCTVQVSQGCTRSHRSPSGAVHSRKQRARCSCNLQ